MYHEREGTWIFPSLLCSELLTSHLSTNFHHSWGSILEAQLRSKRDLYLWTQQMGKWAHGKPRGQDRDGPGAEPRRSCTRGDEQMTGRWRPAFRGRAAFEVRAGWWRQTALKSGTGLRSRLAKRTLHCTWTVLSTDHVFISLLQTPDNADFYEIIFW